MGTRSRAVIRFGRGVRLGRAGVAPLGARWRGRGLAPRRRRGSRPSGLGAAYRTLRSARRRRRGRKRRPGSRPDSHGRPPPGPCVPSRRPRPELPWQHGGPPLCQGHEPRRPPPSPRGRSPRQAGQLRCATAPFGTPPGSLRPRWHGPDRATLIRINLPAGPDRRPRLAGVDGYPASASAAIGSVRQRGGRPGAGGRRHGGGSPLSAPPPMHPLPDLAEPKDAAADRCADQPLLGRQRDGSECHVQGPPVDDCNLEQN